VTSPELTICHGVIDELVRLATIGVPGVARVSRGGPAWRTALAGPAIVTRVVDDGVRIRVWVVARPGQALPGLATQVRDAICATVERLLDLHLDSVTVTVDGVGV
jgi:uncharacterized alkaline shock family protein YloU